ncbi:MAG: hypothetical protein BWY41_00698 [Candidatus Atribacteria bacterium ADurb.Bin276]|uniref:Uncharacterized protein n=1 Tax=Candidatus Atribacter allofermentans TaxID=1852833 RepID=A0A1V5SZX4_9BACT|nr:MAG: hypothetical protein BWY41_00698 [Candidatus Atribacteria bacterium ADurb.Bin276]
MAKNRIFNIADLPLEVAILLIAGLMMLITGILLFPVSTGALPYYENGLYGLLLFIFALQIVTLGKTPFGDMSRSKPLIVIGVIIAAIGIVTCFIPDLLSQIPRILLFICFAPGGFLLLLQMFLSQEKLRTWVKYGGIFKHLIVGCGAVYVLSILIGLLILVQSMLTTAMTAVVGLIFGVAIIYLALVLRKIYLTYPEAENTNPGTVELSTDKMMLLITGVFMLLLGILLIPVNLSQLPFSGNAQLGLLMVIFAIQMLASGSTPIGPFPRNWLMIIFGLLFAALGIISSIIPGILVKPLTILIGVLNIIGGCITLVKTLLPRLKKPPKSGGQVPPILHKLFATQLIMGFLSILFGSSMLVSHLLPGLIVGVVLFANGCVLIYLMSILLTLDKMISQKAGMSDASS